MARSSAVTNSTLIFKIAHALYLKVFIEILIYKKLKLIPIVVFGVININSLIYMNLVGLKGFYKKVFGQKLAIAI